MKIITIFGTRPEAIKMAPLILELKKIENCESFVVSTGQHRELLQPVISLFGLKIDHDLDLMDKVVGLHELSATIITGLKNLMMDIRPDLVLVHGDTTTTMAASIAAFYSGVQIAHVEAGLRSHDKNSPWPEEGNRKVVSALADLHFAPTIKAQENLINEGIDINHIQITGNTVLDALLIVKKKIDAGGELKTGLEKEFNYLCNEKKIILLTTHRRENIGPPLRDICKAVKNIADTRNDVQFVIPLHPNPNIRNVINSELRNVTNVNLIEPLDYVGFIYLASKSFMILTDSGGVQEEAPTLNVPVLILRDTTERPEVVDCGAAELVGTRHYAIESQVYRLLNDKSKYLQMKNSLNPFGDGTASNKIVTRIIKWHESGSNIT